MGLHMFMADETDMKNNPCMQKHPPYRLTSGWYNDTPMPRLASGVFETTGDTAMPERIVDCPKRKAVNTRSLWTCMNRYVMTGILLWTTPNFRLCKKPNAFWITQQTSRVMLASKEPIICTSVARPGLAAREDWALDGASYVASLEAPYNMGETNVSAEQNDKYSSIEGVTTSTAAVPTPQDLSAPTCEKSLTAFHESLYAISDNVWWVQWLLGCSVYGDWVKQTSNH